MELDGILVPLPAAACLCYSRCKFKRRSLKLISMP